MPKRIAIVEDEAELASLIEYNLTRQGYETHVLGGSSGTLKALEQAKPDLIILDVMLPETDGFELCRRIRTHKQSKYTYIIIITALIGKKDYLEGMDAGADDFVTKPFDPDELKARLRVAQRIISFQEQLAAAEATAGTDIA